MIRAPAVRFLRLAPVLLALGAGAASCNFDAALATYCRDTGLCVCEGDSCCGGPQAPCLDGCCGRLVCGEEGLCTTGPELPQLRIEPARHDFPEHAFGAPGAAPEQLFTVSNVGAVPTIALTAVLGAYSEGLVLDAAGCEGKALAPGESCSVLLRYSPTYTLGGASTTLTVQEPVSVEGWSIGTQAEVTAHAGVQLTASVNGVGRVVSEPAGIDCREGCTDWYCQPSCRAWFPGHVPVRLVAEPRPGAEITWSGCEASGDSCTVTLPEFDRKARAELTMLPWLRVRLEPAGARPGVVRAPEVSIYCDGSADAYERWSCMAVTASPVVLVAQPGEGWRFVGWEGACTGTSPECSLEMKGPSPVVARFSL